MEQIQQCFTDVKKELSKVIIGQTEVIDGILTAMIVGGHILLEGPPGVAKTLIAKTMACVLNATYKRVQFTPDLMPMDVIGTNVFDFKNQQFVFKPGPIFTDLLLADEINRTPPKTQAALLEAMEEKQVTIDGELRALSPIFTVIATQNPIEYEGTYPLPEAQLDRFLLKLKITYPAPSEETAIYQRYQNGSVASNDLSGLKPILTPESLLKMRTVLSEVTVKPELVEYIQQIIQNTRRHPLLMLGASPRGGIYLLLTAKVMAASQGRDFVTPDDIQEVVPSVLRHRIIVKPEAQIDGKNSTLILGSIIKEIKVPR